MVAQPFNWEQKVVEDYRQRIIVDADNPILAFKSSRDRYAGLLGQQKYAGLPHLGSSRSEDALTWNLFRSLQKAGKLGVVSSELHIGQPRGLLLWALAPQVDSTNAELQYVTGALLRKFDGIFRGQMTEPDVVLLGTKGIAVFECKLSERGEAPTHLWEGKLDSVRKRCPVYRGELPCLIKEEVSDEEVAPVYQLVRLSFYAVKLGASYHVEPVLVSLANRTNWLLQIRKLQKSPSELWETFCIEMLGGTSPRCKNLTWQDLAEKIRGTSLVTLSTYLSTHPCL